MKCIIPLLNFQTAPSYRRYGFETQAIGEFREGMPVTWRFYLEDGCFEIENYFIDLSVHEEAFRNGPTSEKQDLIVCKQETRNSFAYQNLRFFQVKVKTRLEKIVKGLYQRHYILCKLSHYQSKWRNIP